MPSYLLVQVNVVDGIFQYQGTSQKARHSVAVVAWQSYEDLGDVEYEYVEDADPLLNMVSSKKTSNQSVVIGRASQSDWPGVAVRASIV